MKLLLLLFTLHVGQSAAQSIVLPHPYTSPSVEGLKFNTEHWLPVKTNWLGGSKIQQPVEVQIDDFFFYIRPSFTVRNREYSIVSLFAAAKNAQGKWIVVPIEGRRSVGPLLSTKLQIHFSPFKVCQYADCAQNTLDMYFFVRPWRLRVGQEYEFEAAFPGSFYRFHGRIGG